MPRLLSGIVKKTPAANADPNRYAWLDLTNAEPDLGVPSSNGSLFVSSTTGTRSWSNTITITESVATINTLTVSGNSNLGSNSNVTITGGGPGQFIVTDGAGNLAWSSAAISVASGISNDQSSVAIVAPNGNITMAVAGTLGVVVVSNAGASITGNISVSGNIIAANITANTGTFTGNGAGLSDIAGANVIGTVPSATTATTAGTVTTNAQGNITSVGTLTGLDVNGNITAANITANTGVFTGNGSGLSAIAGANVTGTVASATTADTVTTNAQPNITSVGTLTSLAVTGNLSSGNANLGNLVTANYFSGDGSQLLNIPIGTTLANGTSNINISTANGNISTSINGTPNVFVVTSTGANIAGTLNVTSNITSGNASLGNLAVANFFSGDGSLLTNIPVGSLFANGTSNISIPTANGNVNTSVAGNANILVVTGTGANVTGTLGVTGNANVGNLDTAQVLATANITAPQLISNVATGTAPLVVNSTTTVANLSATTSATAGTVTTNAQGNITSVGTLTGLDVNGNITAANITANTGTFTGNGAGLSAIAGANVTGTVANATFATSAGSATTAGTVTTNAQPNITSVGTLSDLNVSGNTVISGNLIVDGNLVYVNVETLSVEDPIIQLQTGPNGAAPVANSGKDVGTALNYYDTQARVAFMGWDVSNVEFGLASQASITSEVVTFTSYGNLRVGNIIGNGQALTALAGANVTGAVAFATTANTVAGANVTGTVANATTADSATTAGTVTANAQGNITSVGTLTGLTVGNATANTVFGNGTINATGNVTALTFFGNLVGNISGNIVVPGSNTEVLYNNAGNAGASNAFTFNSTSNVLTVAGNVSATNFIGNGAALTALNASNVSSGTLDQARLANSNVILGSTSLALGTTTTTVAGLTSVTSTTFVGALTGAATTAGSVTTNAQGNITSVGTLTGLDVNGNITAANITANTGVFTGNGSGLSAIAGANVTGTVANATFATSTGTAGTVTTNAQPNITSVGNLTGLVVGNATSNVVISNSGTINATGNVTAPFFFGNVQGNISGNFAVTGSNGEVIFNKEGNAGSSNGFSFNTTSNALSVNGTITATNFTANTGVFTGNGSALTALDANNISSGTLAQARLANSNVILGSTTLALGTTTTTIAGLSSVTSTTFVGALTGAATSATTAGTVTTNAQPNITSVGTLTDLTVGNATANAVFGNGTINATGNITAPFFFGNVQGNISGNFAVTGSNGEVIFNKEGNAGSSNAFTFNNATNALSITGTINASSNANVLNLDTTRVIATGNISATQLISNIATGTAPLVVTSTTQVANLNVATAGTAGSATTAGTVTTNAQGNITSVGTLTGLTVGNATANTIFGNGTINATGNISAPFFFGNVQGNISGNFAVTGSNGEVIFNKEGNAGSSNGFTFNNTTNALSVTGNITGSNLVTGGIVSATGNVTTSANLVTNLIIGRTTGITITATGTNQDITLVPTGIGTVDVSSKRITRLATPSASTDAATKQYVDDVAQGLTVKSACQAATTGTLAVASGGTITYDNGSSGVGATLTTTGSYTTIDGVTLVNGDRILVKNEATAANNGIYVRTSTTVLTRSTDFDNSPSGEVAGAFTFISGGTSNADTGFVCTTDNPVVMGTTAITFTQFSGAGTYTAGTGLTLTGSEFSIANTAVTSGSYGGGDRVASFTVNAQGQLTAAANVVIAANAANLSGTVLKSTILTSSLTSVGTLGSLAVTGNITSGNANLGDTARANFFVGDGSQLTNIPIGTSLSNGTSSVSIPTINGSVNTTVAGTIIITATTTGATVTGTLGVSANVTAPQLISNIAAGTSPFVVTSNTVVTNLNADLLDGYNPIVANTANTIALRDASGNLSANFFIGNGSQLTGITVPPGTSIVNGTSNVVVDASGNVRTSIASTPNVFIVSASGANIAGALGVTGNISIGSSYFIGDGSQLTNLPITQFLANGTSNLAVTNNGPVNISVDGAANVVVFSKTIANITGSLGVSGNANVGNLGTATAVITTGNITTINSGLLQNGTSNVVVAASGGNVTLGVAGTNRIIATTVGANVTGTLGVSGNIDAAANVNMTGYVIRSVGTGISAAGSTQGTATAITKEINVVSTVASGAGVVLPTSVAGMVLTVTNTSANALSVYPAVNGIINSQSANAAYSQPAGSTLQFIAPTTTQWYTVGATFA